MSWKGIAVGGCLGSLFGGPLGAILGAVIGHGVESRCASKASPRRASRSQASSGGAYSSRTRRAEEAPSGRERELVFCASAAAMLAKLAKADGRITADEIASVERAFAHLGFSSESRERAVAAFRRAKDDAHTIYEYAAEFASVVSSLEVRELFYGLLWDLACADGVVSAAERSILRRMPSALGISGHWYRVYADERAAGRPRGRAAARDPLAEAYATLGVSPEASDADVRHAYREKAKRFHPDTLRAQGLPDEMVGRATEQMARVNAAWSAIKAKRGL